MKAPSAGPGAPNHGRLSLQAFSRTGRRSTPSTPGPGSFRNMPLLPPLKLTRERILKVWADANKAIERSQAELEPEMPEEQ